MAIDCCALDGDEQAMDASHGIVVRFDNVTKLFEQSRINPVPAIVVPKGGTEVDKIPASALHEPVRAKRIASPTR
jgi:hypothetical protein